MNCLSRMFGKKEQNEPAKSIEVQRVESLLQLIKWGEDRTISDDKMANAWACIAYEAENAVKKLKSKPCQ